MKISESPAVQHWLYLKRKYTEKTQKVYIGYMKMFCQALNKTPDELISDVKSSQTPITELENVHRKLALHMKNNLKMLIRSTDMRCNALHSFYRANGIRLTPEIIRQLSKIVGEVYEMPPRKQK